MGLSVVGVMLVAMTTTTDTTEDPAARQARYAEAMYGPRPLVATSAEEVIRAVMAVAGPSGDTNGDNQ